MPNFTAKDVQALRKSTGAGMMDAKRALEANDGDPVEAAKWLREQGLAGVAKRLDREAGEGTVALVVDGSDGAIVEIRCETDFVAKSPEIVGLAEDLAGLVAEKGEDAVSERDSVLDDLRTTLKENISVGRVVRYSGGDSAILGGYLHVQNQRGVNAVLVEMRGGDADLAHDIALHIASARPRYVSREEVPAADIAEERATVEQIARNEGKPEAQLPKIVEGRMNGFFRDLCLLEQPFVKDEKKTIAEILGGAEVLRFAQVEVGA
jgi:elongation factor Ts